MDGVKIAYVICSCITDLAILYFMYQKPEWVGWLTILLFLSGFALGGRLTKWGY